MHDHVDDTELFAADPAPAVDPIAQIRAAVRWPERFLVCLTARGYEGSFIGEHTARNTERDALAELAEAARGLGYDAALTHGGYLLAIEPQRPVEEEPHDDDYGCDDCEPDGSDPAERFAGQSDRRVA